MTKANLQQGDQIYSLSESQLLVIIEDYITHSCLIGQIRKMGFDAAEYYEPISFDIIKLIMGYPDDSEVESDSPEWELKLLLDEVVQKYIDRAIELGRGMNISTPASFAKELYYELKYSKEALINRAQCH